jgi:hypothetical protein
VNTREILRGQNSHVRHVEFGKKLLMGLDAPLIA